MKKTEHYVYGSRYQQVAVEIAERIAKGDYREGEKLSARSTLASNFGVSPETARKAVNVLVDLEIMDVRHGSGTYVASRRRAASFVERYRDVHSIQDLRREIEEKVERQNSGLKEISELMDRLVRETTRSNDLEPFVPYELKITGDCLYIDSSIGELNVWQKTGATVVAIKRNNEVIVSPGPYARISEGDVLLFVGNAMAKQRMMHMLFPDEKEEERKQDK